MLTADQIARKWADRMALAADAIRQGVLAMREEDNPLEKAAQQQDLWARRVAEAARNNRFAAGLRARTFAEWRDSMLKKGIDNITNGLPQGRVRMQRFLTSFLPYLQGAVQALPPRGTLDANIARATALIRNLAQFNRIQGGLPQMPFAP